MPSQTKHRSFDILVYPRVRGYLVYVVDSGLFAVEPERCDGPFLHRLSNLAYHLRHTLHFHHISLSGMSTAGVSSRGIVAFSSNIAYSLLHYQSSELQEI